MRFRRALALSLMTLLVPGSAQLVAGNRAIARLALRIWAAVVLVIVAILIVSSISPGVAISLAANPWVLGVARIALVLGAIGWAGLFIDAWRLGQPLSLDRPQRRWAVGLHAALALAVLSSMLFGARLVGVQRDFILTMFGSSAASDSSDGRYNILLLGGDAGAGRTGLRPDSITVASIDAETGRTVLISLPRNLANFKFANGSVMAKQFPRGFNCDGCMLNGVSTWANDRRHLFGKSKTPGVDATRMAVEGITGLEISYWAMVNLNGFKQLVDAVGGVTLNVRSRIPVGGLGSDVTGYLEPGSRVLNGYETLWYARAREGSDDYSRMARQKCVMSAMLQQVSPETAVRNFEAIAKASQGMVTTNLPAKELDRFMALALKVKDQKISTVSIVPPAINTGDPDLAKIRRMVARGIGIAEGEITPKKKPKRQHQTTTGGSFGSLRSGYLANQTTDLGASC